MINASRHPVTRRTTNEVGTVRRGRVLLRWLGNLGVAVFEFRDAIPDVPGPNRVRVV